MKKILLPILFVALPLLLFAQGGITNNGASITVLANTDVKIINGGVNNQANGSITNNGNIYLTLNWTQGGGTTSYSGNGWMWFEGAANQNIFNTVPMTISKIRVDNANRLILNNDIMVSTQVDLMNNGSIELGTNDLIINSGANIVNYDASHFIITNNTGILQQEVGASNIFFPIGKTTYNPATLNNSGTLDNFKLRVFNQVFHEGTTGAVETSDVVGRTWMLEETTLGGSNISMVLQWDSPQELTAFSNNMCGISHHLSGTLWDNPSAYTPATNIGGTTYTQTRSGFTSFSPFVVRDPQALLALELLNFEAYRQNNRTVLLDWETVETDNQGFWVERMFENETTFTEITWVDSKGNGNNRYQLNDPNQYQGISYYRLRQIDFDGTVTYSPVRAVSGSKNTANNISLYPIPTKDVLNIDFTAWDNNNTIKIQIVDVQGRLVLEKIVPTQQSKIIHLTEVEKLIVGTYFLIASDKEGLNFVRKFTKVAP